MKKKNKSFDEDVPANATGTAVAGTGDDSSTVIVKKKKKIFKRKKLKGTYEVGEKPDLEAVLKAEGKNMDWLHKLIKQGKSAEYIARTMELDRDTIQALMEQEGIIHTPTMDITPDTTFASLPVFKVDQSDFARCQHGKKRYARWNKHIDTESDHGKRIHAYAKKNPKQSIIVQDTKTGHMIYLKKYSQLEKE